MSQASLAQLQASRYHMFRQHDGKGYGILRTAGPGSVQAIVLDVNLSRDDAKSKLRAYRREEAPAP